jgi:hypothetical protein
LGVSFVLIEGSVGMSLSKKASFWSRWFKPKVPHVRIADAPDGAVVKLVGRVSAAGKLLLSPLGGRECVCFEAVVYHTYDSFNSDGVGGIIREEIGRESKAVDFVLEEETGCAFVRAAGWLTAPSTQKSIGDLNTPAAEAFLKRRHLPRGSYEICEGVIAPGDRIEVLGAVRWERDPAAGGYREVSKRLIVEVPPDGPLVARHKPVA